MKDLKFTKNKKSKRKQIILSCIILVVISILLIMRQTTINISIFISLSIVACYMLYQTLKDKETVIINEKGIFSNVNNMGLIKWEHIKSFEIKKVFNQKLLIVNVLESEKLLNDKGSISKILMKSNIKKTGSPVVIPESEFNYPIDIVIIKLQDYKNRLNQYTKT